MTGWRWVTNSAISSKLAVPVMRVVSSPGADGSSTRLFCSLVSRSYFVQVRAAASWVPVYGARLICASSHSGEGSIVCSTAT